MQRANPARCSRSLPIPRHTRVCSCCAINPKAAAGVSVVLQNQSFDALIKWIADLGQDNQVIVKQISIDGQSEPGLVNARITLI